jgi:hypothetical protein
MWGDPELMQGFVSNESEVHLNGDGTAHQSLTLWCSRCAMDHVVRTMLTKYFEAPAFEFKVSPVRAITRQTGSVRAGRLGFATSRGIGTQRHSSTFARLGGSRMLRRRPSLSAPNAVMQQIVEMSLRPSALPSTIGVNRFPPARFIIGRVCPLPHAPASQAGVGAA